MLVCSFVCELLFLFFRHRCLSLYRPNAIRMMNCHYLQCTLFIVLFDPAGFHRLLMITAQTRRQQLKYTFICGLRLNKVLLDPAGSHKFGAGLGVSVSSEGKQRPEGTSETDL